MATDPSSMARIEKAVEDAEHAAFEALNTITHYGDLADQEVTEVAVELAAVANEFREITGQSRLIFSPTAGTINFGEHEPGSGFRDTTFRQIVGRAQAREARALRALAQEGGS